MTQTPNDQIVNAEPVEMLLNMGPQHPSTHGTLRISMELEGETVIKGTPEIGYLHSGFEKLGEYLDYNQYITITDRMNYLSPFLFFWVFFRGNFLIMNRIWQFS